MELQRTMKDAAHAFWNLVVTGVPPDPSEKDYVEITDEMAISKVKEYEKLNNEFKEAEEMTKDLSAGKRFDVQEKFNKIDTCIMVSMFTEGLNLQTCCDCILHERQWNPANEEQAEGRFIRIGQTSKSVIGTYPTASGTIDEHLARLVEEKRVNFHNAMNNDDGSGQTHAWNQGDIIKELASRIVQDANKVTKAAML